VKGELRSVVRTWGQLAQKIGFLILLVAGSAAVGAAIAWPLWYFATSAREVYTGFVLILAAGGIVFAVVRGLVRARRMPHDGTERLRPLSGLIGVLQGLILLGGLYVSAVLLYHGIWLIAIPALLVSLGLLLLLGLARRLLKASRARATMPKIMKE